MVQVRDNYRAYPTAAERAALARAFGCARVVYNDGLRLRQEAPGPACRSSPTGRAAAGCHEAKRTAERAWLAEVSSVVLVQACNDLHRAYCAYFASLSGRRKGPRIGLPAPRRKRGRQGIRLTRNGFSVTARGVRVAKVGNVALRWSRPLPAAPSSATVVLDSAGRYFVSFVVDAPAAPLPATTRSAGSTWG